MNKNFFKKRPILSLILILFGSIFIFESIDRIFKTSNIQEVIVKHKFDNKPRKKNISRIVETNNGEKVVVSRTENSENLFLVLETSNKETILYSTKDNKIFDYEINQKIKIDIRKGLLTHRVYKVNIL